MRIQYLINRDENLFYEGMDQIFRKKTYSWDYWRLAQYRKRNIQNQEKGVVIFGAGTYGKLTCRSMLYANQKIDCFCDNDDRLWGTTYKDVPIYGLSYVRENFKDSIVVVSVAERYQAQIYHQLICAGVNEADILIPQEGYLFFQVDDQYFDLKELRPEPDGEYFVDAGCYDGKTSLQCKEWCNGNLKMVYAFEPGQKSYQECEKRLSRLGCEYELYNCAAWSSNTVLHFHEMKDEEYGSAICGNGDKYVQADNIDNRLAGRKATYIKYDVEGSEYEALKGSVATIRKYRPKLAISLYHKPEDVIEIPCFLESLGMEYRYYLRQYQTRMLETILYAI